MEEVSVIKRAFFRLILMMSEKALLSQIKGLKTIKPRKEWVVLTKKQILGETSKWSFFSVFKLNFKPAYAGVMAFLIVFGVFGLVQTSLPGDLFYPIKKIAQKGQTVLMSEEEKPVFQLKLANERLEDLTKAQTKNLAPTINEFQATISEAARDLAKIDATTSSPTVIKKIAEEAKKIKENQEKVRSLGVVVGEEQTEELENAVKNIVESLIQDLEGRTLTEEKAIVLNQMKELFKEGEYLDALVLYLNGQ